jgi:hypothetical protein
VLNASILVRKCPEQVNEAFKMLHVRLPESWVYNGPRTGACQALWGLYTWLTEKTGKVSPQSHLGVLCRG